MASRPAMGGTIEEANEWGESAMGGAGTWLARMSRSEQQTRRSERSDGGDGVWYLPSALSRACGVKQRGVAREGTCSELCMRHAVRVQCGLGTARTVSRCNNLT